MDNVSTALNGGLIQIVSFEGVDLDFNLSLYLE